MQGIGDTYAIVDISDISIVRMQASPNGGSRWTALRDMSIMFLEEGAFLDEMLLNIAHPVK